MFCISLFLSLFLFYKYFVNIPVDILRKIFSYNTQISEIKSGFKPLSGNFKVLNDTNQFIHDNFNESGILFFRDRKQTVEVEMAEKRHFITVLNAIVTLLVEPVFPCA